MRRIPIVIVIAAAIGGIVWWLFQGPKPAPIVIPATSAPAAIAQPESAPQSRSEARKITPAPSVESQAVERPGTRAGAFAVMRGRCVDAATRKPLAGCTASLHGWEANSYRTDAHVARHGPIEWKDPEKVVTGADGRFEIRFAPPTPYQFWLMLSADDRANMEGRWHEVKPGEDIDLGDVPMRHGTAVKGRIVDVGGAGRGDVSLALNYLDAVEPAPMGLRTSFNTGSRADGTFVVSFPMQAGTYGVEIRQGELVGPGRIEILESEAERFLELKVRAEPEADTIAGFVRDDAGEPVQGAKVDCDPRGTDSRGMGKLVTSGRDGSFRVQRVNQDPQTPVSLTATRTGYDASSPARAAWGAQDVVLVMRRGLTVQVVVRDGDEDKPLERYGVRCFTKPGSGGRGSWSSEDTRLRERSPHKDGMLELGGVRRGIQVLVVEAEGAEWAPSAKEFEMTDSGAPRQEVTVWRNVKRTVRVKRQDGSTVAKSKVQLLRKKSNEPIDEETRAFDVGQLFMVSGGGLLIAEGLTGDDGTLDLSGPPREQLVLRALGPGHLPVLRELEFGAAEGVIDLVVTSGATFSGTIKPLELLPQLGTEPAPRRGYTWPRGSFSGVFLRRKPQGARAVEYPLGDAAAPIEADGTFRFDGIPAGAWEVHLKYTVPLGEGTSTHESHRLGMIELVDGQERRETYDLGYLLQAELEGVATLDGVALEEGSTVAFEGTREGPDGASVNLHTQGVKVGADGRFRATLWPGEYCIVAYAKGSAPGRSVHGSEIFQIVAGEKLAKTFELKSSVLKLRVVASDGVTPLEGITLEFDVPKTPWWSSRPTDADGSVEIEGLPALPVTILAWPRSLATNEARNQYYREHKTNPAEQRVRIVTITVTPPEASRTITLPASAGY